MTFPTASSAFAPSNSTVGFRFGADIAAERARNPFGGVGIQKSAPAFGTATPGFGQRDDPSDPFGRVKSTPMCFVRNGGIATVPTPSFAFRSTTTGSGQRPPLFGGSTQQPSQSLFGGGDLPFGGPTPQPSPSLFGGQPASSGFGQNSAGFGYSGACANFPTKSAFGTATTSFGIAKSSFGGGCTWSSIDPCFGGSRTVFGSANANVNPSNSRDAAGDPFTSSTASSSTKAASTSFIVPQAANPFAKSATTSFAQSTANPPFAKSMAKPVEAPSVNPFATKVARETAISTVNPFATSNAKTSCRPSENPFAPQTSSNPFGQSVFDQGDSNRSQAHVSGGSSFKWTGFKFNSVVNSKQVFGSLEVSGSNSKTCPLGFSTDPKCQPSPGTQNQPSSLTDFDWTAWRTKNDARSSAVSSTTTANAFLSAPMLNSCSSTSTSDVVVPTTSTLVASPDVNPYGSGSCGDGLVELKVKTAVANPPSSPSLKAFDSLSAHERGSVLPCHQPSARFAARLGLARQPLQVLPMRPTLPRFTGRRQQPVPSSARSKAPRTDVFCFSNAFSRLAVSKGCLKIRVKPSFEIAKTSLSSNATRDPVKKEPEADEVQTPVATDENSGRGFSFDEHVHQEDDEKQNESSSPSPACPVLLSDEYFTVPSVRELQQLNEDALSRVENFVVGRHGCGKISFVGTTDVRGLHLDSVVAFSRGEVVVYPDDDAKPEVGCALNKPAIVHLEGIAPGENEACEDFLKRLEKHTESCGAKFLGFDDNSQEGRCGVWSFRVEHF